MRHAPGDGPAFDVVTSASCSSSNEGFRLALFRWSGGSGPIDCLERLTVPEDRL